MERLTMTSSGFALRRLAPTDLMRLGRVRPPAVTVLLPADESEEKRSLAIRVKQAVDSLFHLMLADSWPPHEIARLVSPALTLAEDRLLDGHTTRGLAMLLDRQNFSLFEVPADVPRKICVASTYYVRPLLQWMSQPREFLILELGGRGIHLTRCADEGLIPLALPSDVPPSPGGLLSLDEAEFSSKGRDHCGRGKSHSGAISFSMASANPERRLQFFCSMTDRALHVMLEELGLPLVVAGPEALVRAYQKENTYHTVIPFPRRESLDGLAPSEVLEQARNLIVAERREEAVRHLVEMEEYAPGDRWSASLATILRAADEGRVWRLFLNEHSRVDDDFLAMVGRRNGYRPLQEDLLNAAAVTTLAHGGEVFEVDPTVLPDQAHAAALFRYSVDP